MVRAGPVVRAPARFGSYRKRRLVFPYLPPGEHATLPTTVAVTAVTSYPSSIPLFFGHPRHQRPAVRCRLGREPLPMATRADQYRQLARDCRLMAQRIPAGENRSALLEMAEEWDRLADQQEHATDLKKE
jgi:hypothetical protein